MQRSRIACACGLAAFAVSAIAADGGIAPTRIESVTDTYHGVTVADPYRWLEDGGSAEVKAWSKAQNARTRAVLDANPRLAALRDELTRMITHTSPSDSDIAARGRSIFEIYDDPKQQQAVLAVLDVDGHAASRRVLLDPNVLDPTSGTSIDWYVPSTDGQFVAVSLSKGGSEDGTLHVYEVASGHEVDAPIQRVQYPTAGGSVAWTADSKAFWYTRYPGDEAAPADRHFYQQAYFHRLGTDWRHDALVLGKAQGLPRTAEIYLNNRAGAAVALASVQKGDGNEWLHYLLRADGATQVGQYADRIVAASLDADGTLYGISRRDALNGKVVKLKAPYAGGFAQAQIIVPEGPTAIVSAAFTRALTLTRERLFVPYIDGGPSQVRVFDHDGGHASTLDLPPISAVSQIEALPAGDVMYSVETYLEPRRYARWEAASMRSRPTELAIRSPVSYADAEVRREFATSKDGTRVPLNIIAKKGIKLDGTHPTLLYGYGGYGVNETPRFSAGPRRLWLDAGGVYVDTNIRGGGDYGERWHEQGALTHKQNVFDDFYAAARWLIDHHYTSSAKLALNGGSNGGLLMGAVLTEHPELARAVVSEVGIYDMLRVELDPNGEFNTTEFGTVKAPEQFRALYAYSPYHHVRIGSAYPAILLATGANDGRVNPMQSRKFAAALQAATASGRPILLRTSDAAGHGYGTPLSEQIAERADMLGFLMAETGARWSPPQPQAR